MEKTVGKKLPHIAKLLILLVNVNDTFTGKALFVMGSLISNITFDRVL